MDKFISFYETELEISCVLDRKMGYTNIHGFEMAVIWLIIITATELHGLNDVNGILGKLLF